MNIEIKLLLCSVLDHWNCRTSTLEGKKCNPESALPGVLVKVTVKFNVFSVQQERRYLLRMSEELELTRAGYGQHALRERERKMASMSLLQITPSHHLLLKICGKKICVYWFMTSNFSTRCSVSGISFQGHSQLLRYCCNWSKESTMKDQHL